MADDAALRLLMADSDPGRNRRLVEALGLEGFHVRTAPALPDAPGSLALVDAVVAPLEHAGGVATAARRLDALVPVVAHADRAPGPAAAAALWRAGVHDVVVLSGDSAAEGVARVRAACERSRRRRRSPRFAEEILGTSGAISQVRRYVGIAAGSSASVLIRGESGTGKELVARAIHRHGERFGGPFVAVNCAALPEALLESELFGHERGAFTGAVARTRGLFEQADGGTLFLDEIGEMPRSLQAKLLRVLQPPPGAGETVRELTRVGGESPFRVDVRVLFATHRDLHGSGEDFRDDLRQRIEVLRIDVPPLRDRREDISLLAGIFLERAASLEGRRGLELDPLALEVLTAHSWPLNVRELESVVRSVVLLKEAGGTVVLGDLPRQLLGSGAPALRPPVPHEENESAGMMLTLAQVEAAHVARVMALSGGNKSRAARLLDISRPALDRRLGAVLPPGGPIRTQEAGETG